MKRNLFYIIIIICLSINITGCSNNKLNKDITLESLTKDNIIFTIVSLQKEGCIPVELVVYKDNKYNLYTSYKINEETSLLEYIESETGTYDYDILKIVQSSTLSDENNINSEKLPDYKIYAGTGNVYIIENGKKNKYLTKFLKQININLNTCAKSE